MSAIPTDAAKVDLSRPVDLEEDSGYEEFLKSFLPPDAQPKGKEPSEGKQEKKTEEQSEEKTEEADDKSDESPDEEEADEESSEEGEEDAGEKRKFADEADAYVKIKVDGKEHEVAVKDLTRLWGQEAALTQKSQTVADERKKVEAELAKNTAVTNKLLESAKKRFEPYSKIDFLLAAQKLSPEEYTALRNEAMAAYQDVQFLESQTDELMKEINTTQQTALRERARESLKELSSEDPVKGIPGWSEKTYDELRTYATNKLGVPADIMNNLVDAWGIRIIHKAMLYDKGTTNKVVTTKVNKTPKKVVKTSTTPEASKGTKGSDAQKAMQRLRQSGSEEDAEAAFLARWADADEA